MGTAEKQSPETFDVLIIGAGLSGICAGHHLKLKSPWANFAILETRDSIGGTWDLFQYPGIRSDSDMFTFGYSLRPWDRANSIGQGSEIKEYIEQTAKEAGIEPQIRFSHKVLSASWSSEQCLWRLKVERSDTASIVELNCRFLFSCTGYYRYDQGYTPDFEAMDSFTGTIVHPQHWPQDLDYANKKVIVIGSGATAVTLIPAMAESAANITMLQRSPTYIFSASEKGIIPQAVHRLLSQRSVNLVQRWLLLLFSQLFYSFSRRFPSKAKSFLLKAMHKQLPQGFDTDHFNPTYDPWDQRLCLAPGGDFFAAIRSKKANVVSGQIERFTSQGLILTSGQELSADIIVTATGLQLLLLGGMHLDVDGQPVDPSKLVTYKGMMLEGVPNMALTIGYTNASWTLKADLTSDYIARLLNEMKRKQISSIKPHHDSTQVSDEPLLALNSGYIRRANSVLPIQGKTAPWRLNNLYVKDLWSIKRDRLINKHFITTQEQNYVSA